MGATPTTALWLESFSSALLLQDPKFDSYLSPHQAILDAFLMPEVISVELSIGLISAAHLEVPA